MFYPGERSLGQRQREARQLELKVEFSKAGPRAVYCGLRYYRLHRGWKPGWERHAFKEIFGTYPRLDDYGPPTQLPGFFIEEWVAARPKPKGRIPKPAPLVDAAERLPIKLDAATGFVENTLMTVEDLAEDWR
jgi:hypothetical protein